MNPLCKFSELESVSANRNRHFVSLFQEILIDLPVGDFSKNLLIKLIHLINRTIKKWQEVVKL